MASLVLVCSVNSVQFKQSCMYTDLFPGVSSVEAVGAVGSALYIDLPAKCSKLM